MRVLIAPDKFKGTLTARQAADAITRGWRHTRPRDELVRLPISDGGDRFGLVLAGLRHARPVRTTTVDAAKRQVEDPIFWPLIPNWNRVESTLPEFLEALNKAVAQDNSDGEGKP